MGEEAFDTAPLLVPDQVGGGIIRTGTQWSATAHIITAVIGSGVLSLAWSVGQLGWIGGPTALIAFAAVTSVQASLLADCYKSPDPEHGPIRNRSYMEAVSLNLGEKSLWVCGFFQQTGLFGCAVAYTITCGNSMRNWFDMHCTHHHCCYRIWRVVTAWSTAQLGWIAAPICMLCFAIVTYISAFLMSECYRTSTGERNRSYMEAVTFYLGTKRTWFCGWLQFVSFYGTAVVYTFTTATCVRAILKSNCYHKEGHEAPCSYSDSFYMILFGAVQIVLCLIPDFHEMAWLSILAAIMSFAYSSIGFGLGLAKVIGDRKIKGSISGIAMPSTTQKVWRVSQALGDIAFAYPYSIILLEIEDTLKSPPAEHKTMKKASMVAVFITTFFYLCCGCFGYAAFGDETPGNLLTGFGFYEPYWLIDFANVCIVIHLVGGYQVYSQPLFSFIDRWSAERFPDSQFVTKFYPVKLPFLPPYRLNLLRLCFRTVYVITTTGLAIYFPFFNQVLGLLGSFGFWPLAIYFPVEMYFVQRKVAPWSKPWVVLQAFSMACFAVCIFAFVGSVEGVISAKIS